MASIINKNISTLLKGARKDLFLLAPHLLLFFKKLLYIWIIFFNLLFTPLESPSIYAGDSRNRKHQLLIEGGVKAQPFLTGFTPSRLECC